MNLYEYQRSRSFIDLGPRSLRFNIFKLLFLKTAGPVETIFHVVPSSAEGMNDCSNSLGHMINMATTPIYGKNFTRTKRSMNMKVCMQHWVLEYYQVCSNDDPGLTLTCFTTMSNSIHHAFVWEKGKTMAFSETIVVCYIQVGRCRQLNEYMSLYEDQRATSFIDLHPSSLTFNIF